MSGYIAIMMCGLCASVFAAVETVDFVEDIHGNVHLWELSETEKDSNGRKFPDGGETITSPV